MSVASLPSELVCASADRTGALACVRVRGGVRVRLEAGPRGTFAAECHEADGYRVRFPEAGHGCEAVLLNTGGGVAGGDAVSIDVTLAPGASATFTSTSAERVYRSAGERAHIDVRLRLDDASRLVWLPQETILSSGAMLRRRLAIDLAPAATLTLADVIVLGRRGHGEVMTAGCLDDRWMVRQAGRIVHMEALRLDGPVDARMQRAANGGGAHVVATLLYIGPDAADRLAAVRGALATVTAIEAAASSWNGKLVVRMLATRGAPVHRAVAAVVTAMTGQPLPRSWAT